MGLVSAAAELTPVILPRILVDIDSREFTAAHGLFRQCRDDQAVSEYLGTVYRAYTLALDAEIGSATNESTIGKLCCSRLHDGEGKRLP